MTVRPLISVVSPVYQCKDCLLALYTRTADSFKGKDYAWELILVDDCAPDAPWPVIADLARKDPRVRGVKLAGNHGQHMAIWAGLAEARGDWIAVIDCDLQDDPTVIPELYAQALKDGVDGVIVDRGEWVDTRFRRFASRLFHKTMKMFAGFSISSNIGNFGLYSRKMINMLLQFRDKEVFFPVMVSLTGLPRSFYKIDRDMRHTGQSSYNLTRLIRLAISIIIRFSDRPLKLSILLGLAFSSISALVSVVLVLAWLTGAFTVPGWTSLILSTWFIGGLILAVLGVHGFYVGRIFREVQDRPRILVDRVTDDSSETTIRKSANQ